MKDVEFFMVEVDNDRKWVKGEAKLARHSDKQYMGAGE